MIRTKCRASERLRITRELSLCVGCLWCWTLSRACVLPDTLIHLLLGVFVRQVARVLPDSTGHCSSARILAPRRAGWHDRAHVRRAGIRRIFSAYDCDSTVQLSARPVWISIRVVSAPVHAHRLSCLCAGRRGDWRAYIYIRIYTGLLSVCCRCMERHRAGSHLGVLAPNRNTP